MTPSTLIVNTLRDIATELDKIHDQLDPGNPDTFYLDTADALRERADDLDREREIRVQLRTLYDTIANDNNWGTEAYNYHNYERVWPLMRAAYQLGATTALSAATNTATPTPTDTPAATELHNLAQPHAADDCDNCRTLISITNNLNLEELRKHARTTGHYHNVSTLNKEELRIYNLSCIRQDAAHTCPIHYPATKDPS